MKKIFTIGLMLSQLLMCSHALISKDSLTNKDGIEKKEYVGMYDGKYEGEV